jgi:AcrR family transcriptional regulator
MAAVQPNPTESPREPLTRERVFRAAIDLADASGIDALSMRRLAQELGVEAMSLYHHVRNKDDLLDGMVEVVTDEFELPTPGGIGRPRSAEPPCPPTTRFCGTHGRPRSASR